MLSLHFLQGGKSKTCLSCFLSSRPCPSLAWVKVQTLGFIQSVGTFLWAYSWGSKGEWVTILPVWSSSYR